MARAHNGSLLDFDTDTIKYNVSMKTCHLCLSEFFAQSDLLEHIDNDHDLRHPFKRGKSVDSMNISKIQILRPDIDWTDTDRINVLYAPFRARHLNPESYEAKMTFWTETISKWLHSRNKFRFKIEDTRKDFQDQTTGRRPLCLEEVLLAMRDEQKCVIEINEFKKNWMNKSAWSDVPWKLIKAGTSMLVSAISPKTREQRNSEVKDIEFININMVKKLSQELFMKIQDTGNAYCKKIDVVTNEENDDILLEYLKSARNVIDIKTIDGEVYIKDTSANKSIFNETDIAIIKLDVCIENLEHSATELDHKLQAKKVELKNIISKRESMARAKNVLRQVKHLSRDLDQKTSSIDNLRKVLETIESSKENAKVVSALKAAKIALNSTNVITSEEVQDLVEDIKELVEKNDEVIEALSWTEDRNSSSEDLENELKKMIDEENDQSLEKAFLDLKLQSCHGDDLEDQDNTIKEVQHTGKKTRPSPERVAELGI